MMVMIIQRYSPTMNLASAASALGEGCPAAMAMAMAMG